MLRFYDEAQAARDAATIDLTADVSDHDAPAAEESAVIDLTADFSDHETPTTKKRKLKTASKKANKKKKNFAIVFKFEGIPQRTLDHIYFHPTMY